MLIRLIYSADVTFFFISLTPLQAFLREGWRVIVQSIENWNHIWSPCFFLLSGVLRQLEQKCNKINIIFLEFSLKLTKGSRHGFVPQIKEKHAHCSGFFCVGTELVSFLFMIYTEETKYVRMHNIWMLRMLPSSKLQLTSKLNRHN